MGSIMEPVNALGNEDVALCGYTKENLVEQKVGEINGKILENVSALLSHVPCSLR